eukprot:Colp12_sorted_trinity150504_noHs@10206
MSSWNRSHSGNNNNTILHPTFSQKAVVKLNCRYCENVICWRGMRAILLADTKVELYSTDLPPNSSVQLIAADYTTKNCHCKIRDVCCLTCGNVVGYHVTQPCAICLEACNNGHFWMFHSDAVKPVDRLDRTGKKVMLWASIPPAKEDHDLNRPYKAIWADECCR